MTLISKGAEPPAPQPPPWLAKLSNDDLIDNYLSVEMKLKALQNAAKPHVETANAMRAEIARRCAGKQLPHPEYVVKVERKSELVKREDVFLELRSVDGVDLEEVEECVRTVVVTEVKTYADKLKRLANKYSEMTEVGKRLRDIYARACVYVEGPERLIIHPKKELPSGK